MERLINRARLYFDYNATSPLAATVKQWLVEGDFPFANPAAVHASGKMANRLLSETKEYLLELFNLKAEYEVFFHSGATEGINTIIRGLALNCFERKQKFHFFCAGTDHSCVYEQKAFIESLGHHWHEIAINQQGNFDQSKLIKDIQACSGTVLLNYTQVNNETGVIWPLVWAEAIKSATQCLVHVDAVQSVGKIQDWEKISNQIDYYTYSAHKFGAMKGIGFCFIKDGAPFKPLLVGGGQQHNFRSGTENVLGIYSIKLALEEMQQKFNAERLQAAKSYFEHNLQACLKSKGEIVGFNNPQRALNTIYFILYHTKADILSTAFDLAGMDVSMGSACSSGAIKPSRVLMKMGYSERLAKSAIRLSFTSYLDQELIENYLQEVLPVLRRFV